MHSQLKKGVALKKENKDRVWKNKFGGLKKYTTFALPNRKKVFRKTGLKGADWDCVNSQLISCNKGYKVIISSLNIWKQQQLYFK